MQNLIIEAKLASPLIMQGYLTFDALLMALDYDRAIEVLDDSEGLYHASAAIVDPYHTGSRSFAASMRWQHDWPTEMAPKNSRGGAQKLSSQRRREYGQILDHYTTIHANWVRWYVRGDRAGIGDLVRDVKAIGKKRSQGYGLVSGWGVRIVDEDHSIVGPSGEPMRPVPHDRFTGVKSHPLVEAAWKGPYWDVRNRAVCYAPEMWGGAA